MRFTLVSIILGLLLVVTFVTPVLLLPWRDALTHLSTGALIVHDIPFSRGQFAQFVRAAAFPEPANT